MNDCIVSGATMQRGKQFMEMLLMESEEDIKNVSLYKGAIVLANRSSYETIQNLMDVKSVGDFLYFIRLNVPSYNTHNGICPACELSKRYHSMHKRSSSYLLAEEYTRLKEKYKSKVVKEHDYWLEKNIMNMEGYKERFLQRIYYSHFGNDNILSYFNAASEFCEINSGVIKQDHIKTGRNLIELFTDEKGEISENDRIQIISFVKQHVI